MLAFDVIYLEQYRALHQNAARAHLPEFPGSEIPLIPRSSSGPKLTKLNRQIPELKRRVTHRKQTTETYANRQKIQKRSRPFPKPADFSSERDLDTSATRKMDLPPRENEACLQSANTISTWPARYLLGGLALCAFRDGFIPQKCISNRFWAKNRSCRKQTTKPLLTGSRFVCLENALNGSFSVSAAGFFPRATT